MKLLLITGVLLCGVVLYYSIDLSRKLAASRALIASAVPFERTEEQGVTTTLLVLGDSTAVGVGADTPSESLPALVAGEIKAGYVENRAQSGARTADLLTQIESAERRQYDYILIQIGGNDVIRFHSAQEASTELAAALTTLPDHDKLIVLSAGNVGSATFFPHFLRPHHTKLNRRYHDVFETVTQKNNGTYVNLYEPPATDPFVQQPEVYLAADGLHPSSAGYALWFEKIRARGALK